MGRHIILEAMLTRTRENIKKWIGMCCAAPRQALFLAALFFAVVGAIFTSVGIGLATRLDDGSLDHGFKRMKNTCDAFCVWGTQTIERADGLYTRICLSIANLSQWELFCSIVVFFMLVGSFCLNLWVGM